MVGGGNEGYCPFFVAFSLRNVYSVYMRTSLIAVTKPVIKVKDKDMSAEDLIVYVARVSNPKNQENLDTGSKLLKYCIKNRHWSIFETASMTIEVKTSLAIATQILRHRSFQFQMLSRRYSSDNLDFDSFHARRQDAKNRQNSIDDLPDEVVDWFFNAQKEINVITAVRYQEALDKGICKEQARMLLPVSSETVMYVTGSVRSWIHYLQVRCDQSTQLEHREVADAIKVIFKEQFPITSEAMEW